MGKRLISHKDRFWNAVDITTPNACWEWKQGKSRHGYGKFSCNHKTIPSHRYAWMLKHGPIPDGMCICHKCDNRACCNPKHLWMGTNDENMKDMVRKGRAAHGDTHGTHLHPELVKGENNGNSKLTEKEVIQIRMDYDSNKATAHELAIKYNVTYTNIKHIVLRKFWKHI